MLGDWSAGRQCGRLFHGCPTRPKCGNHPKCAPHPESLAHRLARDEVEGDALSSKAPAPPDSVQVGLKGRDTDVPLHRQIQVDHQGHLRDVERRNNDGLDG